MASIDEAIRVTVENYPSIKTKWNVEFPVAIRYAFIEAYLDQFFDIEVPRIISGGRTPAHNAAVGGVRNSRHLITQNKLGRALDVVQGDQNALLAFSELWKWFGGRWGGDFSQPSRGHFDLGLNV